MLEKELNSEMERLKEKYKSELVSCRDKNKGISEDLKMLKVREKNL